MLGLCRRATRCTAQPASRHGWRRPDAAVRHDLRTARALTFGPGPGRRRRDGRGRGVARDLHVRPEGDGLGGTPSAAATCSKLQAARTSTTLTETSDGRYMAVGAIEPQFVALLLEGFELDASQLPAQLTRKLAGHEANFYRGVRHAHARRNGRCIFADSDACVSPVLTPEEASTTHTPPSASHFVVRLIRAPPEPNPAFFALGDRRGRAATHGGTAS